MSNLVRMKKSIGVMCMLLLVSVFTMLVSTTQANESDAVTVLVYAPNSAEVVANLETATATAEGVHLVSSDSVAELESQLSGANVLFVDGAGLDEIDAERLQDAFTDDALIVVGVNTPGETLATTVGQAELYTRHWNTPPAAETGDAPYYFALRLDVQGRSGDVAEYLASDPFHNMDDAPTLNVANPLAANYFADTDSLSEQAEYVSLLETVHQLSLDSNVIVVPTFVGLSNIGSVSGFALVWLIVGVLGMAVITRFVVRRRTAVYLSAVVMFSVFIPFMQTTPTQATGNYYQRTETRDFSNGVLKTVYSSNGFWADANYDKLLVTSDSSMIQTSSQLSQDSLTDVTYTAQSVYCQFEMSYRIGCYSQEEGNTLVANLDTNNPLSLESAVAIMDKHVAPMDTQFVLSEDALKEELLNNSYYTNDLPNEINFYRLGLKLAETNGLLFSGELTIEQFSTESFAQTRSKQGQQPGCTGVNDFQIKWYGYAIYMDSCWVNKIRASTIAVGAFCTKVTKNPYVIAACLPLAIYINVALLWANASGEGVVMGTPWVPVPGVPPLFFYSQ